MIVNGNKFTVGADPELFACTADGHFVSGHDLVPGDKQNPFVVNKGAVQVDGMALEFNIDPASTLQEFIDNITTVQATIQEMIGGLDIMKCASVNFDGEFLKGVPKFNQQLGCQPDFNGWTESINQPPNAATLMRTAGGHVHIGGFNTKNPFRAGHFRQCARLARILDEELAIPSLFWDDDDQRRSMYGQAGCFRPKKYGMEYRTLSNRWIFDNDLVAKVYNGVERALHKMSTDYEPDESVKDIVNTSDREAALNFVEVEKMVA